MSPIVLQHGLFGFGDFSVGPIHVSYFNKIDRAIAARGHPLIVARVHPTGSIARRAMQLKETIVRHLDVIDRANDGRRDDSSNRVAIIAHSMGGLDARYMISRLGMSRHVSALVTIATPHRGSPVADRVFDSLGKLGAIRFLKRIGLDIEACNDLTTTSCARFNAEIPDHPDVRYFSVSTARPWHRVPPFYMGTHRLITQLEGDNDGIVSVRSSTWGEHLGVWPADHLHAINKRMVLEIVKPTGDMRPRYLELLDKLASRGLIRTQPASASMNEANHV